MLGSIASIVSIAGGLNSLFGGGGGGGGQAPSTAAGSVTAAADPLAPFRANLASMYSGYLQPGASADVTSMPGYQAYKTGIMDPAMDASKRSAAASGQLYSGNEQIGLQKTAQQGYYGFMTDYLNRLAQGSGATLAPSNAVGLGLQANQAGWQSIGQGIGGLGGLFSGSGGGGYGGGITSAGMQAQTYVPYGGGDALPMGYANF